MLASGVGLSIAGFIAPPFGEISDSVLWFFAQCLIYAGTALGFDVMIETKLRSLSKEYSIELKLIHTNYPQIYLIPVIVVNKNKNNTPTSMCAYSTCKM